MKLLGLGVVLALAILTILQEGGCEENITGGVVDGGVSSTLQPPGSQKESDISIPPSARAGTPTDEEKAATLKEFQLLMKMPKRSDDCDYEGTDRALKFLALTTDDLRNKTLKELEDLGVKHVDCSLRKTEVDKLRAFLVESGFTKPHPGPGSLVFVNGQDETIKLKCGKAGNARWTTNGSIDDKKFNEDSSPTGNTLDHRSPTDSLYFRTYTCRSIDDDNKCSHVFYVITRPEPKILFPLQFGENENIKISCAMNSNPCLFETCDNIVPRPAGAYEFQWSFPHELFEDNVTRGIGCKNGPDDDSSPNGPIYVQFQPDSTGKPVFSPKPLADSGVEVTLSGKVNVTKGSEKVETVVESTLVITMTAEKHRGHYECIVIDGNGVPSIPSDGSMDVRFSGRAFLHIRRLIWTIIPFVLIIVMLLAVLLIGILSPIKMEDDDGNPMEKEDAVAPEESTAAPAEPGPTPPSEGGDVPPDPPTPPT